ncbi:MAG: class B sortase, partial [Oscillospiraceae bacterium]|nr:class B sortase [Oscillospiraceae bacterium]
IFSDDFNSAAMTDPVTILYGHNLRNGTMFAKLNDFADAGVFENHRYIYLYLPDRALIYEIFSAAPHSNEQILNSHDFTDRAEYEACFGDVASVTSAAQRREDCFPTFGERVLILSTCYRVNNQQRFLVMGRLVAEIPAA